MLEKLPSLVGKSLRAVRPGLDRVVSARKGIVEAPMTLDLESGAFANQDTIPRRFTADGAGKTASPPLRWRSVPADAQTLILIVEDADSPTPQPLVHAIVTGLPATADQIAENALVAGSGLALGKNSYFNLGWLPPDPPPGHGPHRYVFQLFALDTVPELGAKPGRHAIIEAAAGHTIARGMLIGITALGARVVRSVAVTDNDGSVADRDADFVVAETGAYISLLLPLNQAFTLVDGRDQIHVSLNADLCLERMRWRDHRINDVSAVGRLKMDTKRPVIAVRDNDAIFSATGNESRCKKWEGSRCHLYGFQMLRAPL